MTMAIDTETFLLVAPPASPAARAAAKIRAAHAERDRVRRREPDHEAFAARALFVTSGVDLVSVHDPADGATLDAVVELLADRVEQASVSRIRSDRWWERDLCVWQGGRLVAAITRDRDGSPVVFRPEEGRR
jgi:hypothetical protein